MVDAFWTIENKSEALFKEKASKFYAYCFPVRSTEEVEDCIHQLKKEHFKAGHFCYAYFLGADRMQFRANDDGEPSGTAGRPILGQLEKRTLTNVLCVVVRYFGGTKLGTSGLIQAYKESASLAIESSNIIEEIIPGSFRIRSSYDHVGPLMSILSAENLKITNSTYEEDANLTIEVRKSELALSITKIKALLLNRSIEDIQEDTELPGIDFEVV